MPILCDRNAGLVANSTITPTIVNKSAMNAFIIRIPIQNLRSALYFGESNDLIVVENSHQNPLAIRIKNIPVGILSGCIAGLGSCKYI
jgi:hypothetical protein